MKSLFLFCLLFSSLLSFSQTRILVDGIFDEWDEYQIIYDDASGDGGSSGIDFGELQVYHDDEFIFFFLETGAEINLQDENEISLYLDTDDNASTGFAINGIGAELMYNFGNRAGVFYEGGSSTAISHHDIGLVSAPTVTSDRFEIAIKRELILAGIPIFLSDGVTIVLRDGSSNGDVLPAENEEIAYAFSADTLESLPAYSLQKLHESDVRFCSYNVLTNGLFDQSRVPAFSRIFQATQPDIIGFQEINNYTSTQVAAQMESILPSAAGQQWYHAKQGPDCHAISRYPILASALIPGYNSGAGNGAFLIDIPGLATDMLLIVAHPPCCTNNSGRQIEVDLMMQFLREAKAGNGPIPLEADAPIVILGDMNFVGEHRQVETLLSGNIADEASYGPDFTPDWDGNDLLDSHPYTTGVPFSYTWYREGSSFSPGRLDYLIYSGSNLTLRNKYSLFTPRLPQDSLTAFTLMADDAVVASDHLPIFADFEFKNLTTQNNSPIEPNPSKLAIHPNPAHGWTEVSFRIYQPDLVVIRLLNQAGKEIAVLPQTITHPGEHSFQFDTSNIPAGMYLLSMKTTTGTDVTKMIILK